jgi:hypothetical protein
LKRLDWGGGRTKHNQASKRSSSTNHSIEMCRLLSTYYKLFGRQQHRCAEVPKERSRRAIHTHSISHAALLPSPDKIAAPRLFVALDGEIQNICDACLLNLQCCCNRSSNRICSDCIITSSTRESGTTVRLPRERELLGIFDMVPPQLLAAIGQAFQTRDRRIAQGMCVLHPRLAPA